MDTMCFGATNVIISDVPKTRFNCPNLRHTVYNNITYVVTSGINENSSAHEIISCLQSKVISKTFVYSVIFCDMPLEVCQKLSFHQRGKLGGLTKLSVLLTRRLREKKRTNL